MMHSGHVNAPSSGGMRRRNEGYSSSSSDNTTLTNNGGEGFSGLFVSAMGALGLLTGSAGVYGWDHAIATSELQTNATNQLSTKVAAEKAAANSIAVARNADVTQEQVEANTEHIAALNAQVVQLTKALKRYTVWPPSDEASGAIVRGNPQTV